MKRVILTTLSIAIFTLVGCGDDENAAKDASIKAEILQKQKLWLDFKESISGNYDMIYEESGFVESNGEQKATVRNDIATQPVRVTCAQGLSEKECEASQPKNGSITMDRIYNAVLELFDSQHCELDKLVFEDSRPVIKRYSAVCGSEEYQMTVESFTPVQ